MVLAIFILISAGFSSAFPSFANIANNPKVLAQARDVAAQYEAKRNINTKRQAFLNLTQDPLGISRAQTNCGPTPCLTFDPAEQFVSTTGENEWVSPGAGDIRGPCPGLNAASNHGYLPRNGIASVEQTISGLGAAYGMSPELAAALAIYAITLDGNVLEAVWSIGGPLPSDYLGAGVIGTGQGLSYSHNNYEGDASIGRNDAYINGGDAHSLNISKFEIVYAVGGEEDRYTLDKFRQNFGGVQQESIRNNPYYFTGLFSTIVVVPAAYNFVINFMSNHSAAEPSGYLNGAQFKSFFGVTGEPGSFVWQRGQERIPDNWYRRPSSTPYTVQDVVADVGLTYLAYPDTLLIGGNAGKTNSFIGVNPSNLTGGIFSAESLTQGNNLGCFLTLILQNGIPDAANPLFAKLSSAIDLANSALTPLLGDQDCPQIGQFDQTIFNQFPGYKYSPTGPDTNY